MIKVKLLILPFSLWFYSLVSCAEQPDIPVSISNQYYHAELVSKDIDVPWGMAWIDKQTFLVTDRKGELRIIQDGKLLDRKVEGLPKVNEKAQGGLLDVVVDPDYSKNGWIYFSYSGFEGEGEGSNTSVMRAKLKDFQLVEQQLIFDAQPNTDKHHHYGGRLQFDRNGYLYISVGDRGEHFVNPQDLSKVAGKVHRIHADGRIPKDNPFVKTANVQASIYAYGLRNPQGMERHPLSGEIWTHEHGPKGGDEINIIKKGANYGWPIISYGVNYNGTSITELTHKEGMLQPLWHWTPSIAPSGMTFVTSEIYPDWQGKLLVGSLKFNYLVLLDVDINSVKSQEIVMPNIGRVRNVKQGADGYIYVGISGAGVFKLVPTERALSNAQFN